MIAVCKKVIDKYRTSKNIRCKVFDINALIGQNLTSKSILWVLIIVCKWDVRFSMYMLGAACCQQIHWSQIWLSVLSVVCVYNPSQGLACSVMTIDTYYWKYQTTIMFLGQLRLSKLRYGELFLNLVLYLNTYIWSLRDGPIPASFLFHFSSLLVSEK